MRSESSDLTMLVDEYQTLVTETGTLNKNYRPGGDLEKVKRWLIAHGEWTPRAAAEVVDLIETYGAFVLRNAAALAIALDVEDGRSDL